MTADFLGKFAVFGNPISHSKSPAIHRAFAAQIAKTIDYQAICPPADFKTAVANFIQAGGVGLNVTVPFKEAAYTLCDQLDPSAQQAGAVNTIKIENGKLLGYNTDGSGLVWDICQHQKHFLAQKKLIIIGAGGAVRGILPAILAKSPQCVVIANRTLARAQQLAADFHHDSCSITALALEDLPTLAGFDVLINATTLSLEGKMPPLVAHILAADALVVDLVYAATATPTQQWAQSIGRRSIDGSGMLVAQAASAFAIWTGFRVDCGAVLSQFREGLLV